MDCVLSGEEKTQHMPYTLLEANCKTTLDEHYQQRNLSQQLHKLCLALLSDADLLLFLLCCKELSLSLSLSLSRSPSHHRPSLQRQCKAMKDWRQSDVLWFILPESLRMLSVPHEGSDESCLSVCHLIISQERGLPMLFSDSGPQQQTTLPHSQWGSY